MVKVKILGQVVTQYGTHRTDDILTVSEAFARHLVVDVQAAEYVKAPVAEPSYPVVEQPTIDVTTLASRKGKK